MHSATYQDSTFERPSGISFASSGRYSHSMPDLGDPSRYSPSSNPGGLGGTPSLFEQSSYPRLFQSSAELPRFQVSYRWWEDEATTVLWAFDIQEIKRVIRYGLFRDKNFPRTALLNRNENTIDNFLVSLAAPHELPFLSNLSHMQKVEEILGRSRMTDPPLVPWSWFPSQQDHQPDPETIASMIDAESHLHFSRISFEEWVRYSLGYPAAAVEWFLEQHTALFVHLLTHLHAHPEDVPNYEEVEKHLRKKSPFAHRVVVRCLTSVHAGHDLETPSSSLGFEFIAGPIQRMFREHPPSLSLMLKVLCVLTVRFRRTYIHTAQMNWGRKFDTSVPFLQDISASTSAVDLARILTNADVHQFAGLSQQNIVAEDSVVRRLLAKWHILSIEVWECCVALPDLTGYIQESVQALLAMRDYHSLTAIMNGLHKYRISTLRSNAVGTTASTVSLDPLLHAEVLYIMNPHSNYAAYRQQFQAFPGIPFLFPHIREYKQLGELVLHQLFQDMQRTINYSA